MSTIGERITLLISDLNISKNEFAKEINISSSLISQITTKKNNFGIGVAEKIITKYPTLNAHWLLTGIGEIWTQNQAENPSLNTSLINVGDNLTTYNNNIREFVTIETYESNKAMFYYGHPDTKLNSIYARCLGDLLKNFNDYLKLIKVSNSFGAPEFMQEKFKKHQNFKEYKKDLDEEIIEIHNELNDERLIKCIKIVHYEEGIEYYQNAISQLINYMDMYADFYKGYQKSSEFNN